MRAHCIGGNIARCFGDGQQKDIETIEQFCLGVSCLGSGQGRGYHLADQLSYYFSMLHSVVFERNAKAL